MNKEIELFKRCSLVEYKNISYSDGACDRHTNQLKHQGQNITILSLIKRLLFGPTESIYDIRYRNNVEHCARELAKEIDKQVESSYMKESGI